MSRSHAAARNAAHVITSARQPRTVRAHEINRRASQFIRLHREEMGWSHAQMSYLLQQAHYLIPPSTLGWMEAVGEAYTNAPQKLDFANVVGCAEVLGYGLGGLAEEAFADTYPTSGLLRQGDAVLRTLSPAHQLAAISYMRYLATQEEAERAPHTPRALVLPGKRS